MQDTYNLGWKIGLVCKKILRREILSTYELEVSRLESPMPRLACRNQGLSTPAAHGTLDIV